MNKVFILGNLAKDPELTTTKNGASVCRMKVAVNRKMQDATDFFNVVAWRVLAENCVKFLKKGNKVAVCGELQNGSYESQNGEKRYITEIVAEEVQFLTEKKSD